MSMLDLDMLYLDSSTPHACVS